MNEPMSTYTLSRRVPWLDRWNEPTVEQLIEALKPHQQKNFSRILEFLGEYAEIERSLIWYGASWKWTLHFKMVGSEGDEANTMCYIVPAVETPLIAMPFSVEFVGSLPIRRLSKFIRDGIRGAKCAVNFHWASWTPGLDNEVGMILDLLKRKYKFHTGTHTSDKD